MIDHVGVPVSDYARSKEFYAQALAPLGFAVAMEFEGRACGFAREGKPWFWIHQGETTGGVHVAFRADDTATVDAFHEAALAAGGTDNGPPGIREHYHPTYYAAFVHDPDGYNVEAVNHG